MFSLPYCLSKSIKLFIISVNLIFNGLDEFNNELKLYNGANVSNSSNIMLSLLSLFLLLLITEYTWSMNSGSNLIVYAFTSPIKKIATLSVDILPIASTSATLLLLSNE